MSRKAGKELIPGVWRGASPELHNTAKTVEGYTGKPPERSSGMELGCE